MTTFASIVPAAQVDGVCYCSASVLPSTEMDLFNCTGLLDYDPAPVLYNQAVIAVVQLAAVDTITTNSSFVVLQGAMDDNVWFDLSWLTYTGLTGDSSTFVLSAGSTGASAFQQSRANGTAPAGTEFNQCPLPGRIRFTGQATVTGGGTITATIKFKRLGLR